MLWLETMNQLEISVDFHCMEEEDTVCLLLYSGSKWNSHWKQQFGI